MKTKDKISLFRKYYGAKFQYEDDIYEMDDISSDGWMNKHFHVDDCKLVVKKLIDCKDKELIKIAKLFRSDYTWNVVREKNSPSIIIKCLDYRIFIYDEEFDILDVEEKTISEWHPTTDSVFIKDAIDYCREHSIDVDNLILNNLGINKATIKK